MKKRSYRHKVMDEEVEKMVDVGKVVSTYQDNGKE